MEVIKHFPLPIEWFSEECSESSNKIFKRFRQHRARKCSRVKTMTDVFHRMLHCSDPLTLHSPINKNLANATKKPFSEAVSAMLLPFEKANFMSFENYMKKQQ